jgi:hypothetical protein
MPKKIIIHKVSTGGEYEAKLTYFADNLGNDISCVVKVSVLCLRHGKSMDLFMYSENPAKSLLVFNNYFTKYNEKHLCPILLAKLHPT